MVSCVMKEKSWSKGMEQMIWENWRAGEANKFIPDSRKIFSIDTPPPYVNTPIHIGHAATYVLMDMFARFHRMIGDSVLFPLGLDRNGLPIEMAAEKRFGVSMHEVSREEFLEMCRKILEESSAESISSFLRLGISFSSWKAGTELGDLYLTDSKEYRILTQNTFIHLWKKGLIYEDDRINNYCPGCKTILADAEIDYEEKQTLFNDIKFRVKGGKDIIIGTTRPELLCTCAMVIFHPDDKRYKKLEGKTAIIPIFSKEVPIKAHPLADPSKGTGLAMMCAFGDQSDIRFFRELDIKPVIAIDDDGKMNRHAGLLAGLGVKEAREKILEELKEKDLLVSQKRIMHRTPVCERSKDDIEFVKMKEFYLKQMEFKEHLIRIADKINFYAPSSKRIFIDWVNSISIDWPISRRRYYGTEIPLWYCADCESPFVPEPGYYYQPWRESPPAKQCEKCGCKIFRGEERVFDTWFDSANSWLYILKYHDNEEFFSANKPASLRPQGKEIVRTWLYYTLLKAHLLLEEPAFHDVWIHHHILDEHGKKMSKSMGNVIDPKDVLDKFGAEPFRLWCALEGNLEKDDMKCSFERISGSGKTLTKLWNIAKFIQQFQIGRDLDFDSADITLAELDKWIIKETNELIKYSRSRYEIYDFHNPAVKLRHFLWETFASHYMELVKNRAYNQHKKFEAWEQKSAIFTLHYCLNNMLRLLAPILPFVTSHIYKELYGKDIHSEHFPKYIVTEDTAFKTGDIEDLNNAVWKAKKDKGLSLKAEIKKLTLPERFKSVEKDVQAAHSAQDIDYADRIEVLL